MGLFENLFKHRPEGSVERVVEAPGKGAGVADKAGADETELDPANAFLHPKGYAPGSGKPTLGGQNQGFVPVLPSAKKQPSHERRPAAAEPPQGTPDEIVLTVGDVLPRIPVALLRPGPRDLKRELRFHIDHLSSDMARGRPAIALSVIAEQCPELFHSHIGDDDDMEIRLPLQKLVEQVGRIRSRAPAPPAPIHPPQRAPVAAPAPGIVPPVAPARMIKGPAVEHIAAQFPGRVAPSVRAEAKPILSPPPVEAAPAVEAIHPPPVAQVPAPLVEPPAVAPPADVPTAAVESVPAPPPKHLEEVAHLLATPEPTQKKEPATEPMALDEPVPEPAEPARHVEVPPTGSVIELGLAAVVAKLPREMFVGEMPHIAESERISLPFPMIERQLGTGIVEIPAKLLWSSLPPLRKHQFHPREDLSVALPLEEIFQNLPVGGIGGRLKFDAPPEPSAFAREAEAPIVLAPPLHEDEAPQLDFDAASKTEVQPPTSESESLAKEPPAEPFAKAPAEILATIAEPKVASSVEAPALAAEPATSASGTAASAEPDAASAERPGTVQLQPFHAFTPISLAVQPETKAEVASSEPVVLGNVPSADDQSAQILRSAPDDGARKIAESVEAVDEPTATAPASPLRILERPQEAAPSVAAPERVILPPDPEPLVAFTPDQPPPLKVEQPAAAVAELRATVPEPVESPMLASATTTVQPPRMFRPMVLPPPIASQAAPMPLKLAPTLGGPAATGMITLSSALQGSGAIPPAASAPAPVAPQPPAPPPRAHEPIAPVPLVAAPPVLPQPSEPASKTSAPEPRESGPKFKSLVRRLFAGGDEHDDSPAPEAPAVESVAPAAVASEPAAALPIPSIRPSLPAEPAPSSLPSLATAADGSPFQLSLPPAPQVAAAASPELVPPSLPISRLDQHSLQSVFMTDEILDLPKVSRLAAALPGIQACVIATRGETFSSGEMPKGFHLSALRGLAPQIGAAADRLPIGELKNFTLYGEDYSISFFERTSVCLCAIHRARSFVPGVRERLVTVADELARA